MQKRTIFSILSFVLLFISFQMMAQVKTTNENGEAIIRYPDGTWEYAEEKASISEADSRKKVQLLAIEARRLEADKIKAEKLMQLEYDRKKTKATYTKDAEAKKIAKAELKILKGKLKKSKEVRKTAAKNARFYEGLLDMSIEKREAALAKKIEKEAIAKRKAEREALGLEEESTITETKARRPKAEKKKRKPKKAKKTRKKIDTSDLAETKVRKPKKKKKVKKERVRTNRATKAPEIPGVLTRMDKINLAEKRQKDLTKKYDFPIKDYANNKDCSFAFNERDEFTGESKKGLKSRLFFTNTDESLIPFMNGEDFLICEGYLAQVSGGRVVLALTYTMKSEDAIRQYGRLDAGSALKLKLLDGSSITLWNNREDPGMVNKRKQTTVYQGFYNISQGDAKKLGKSEVSKARVVWSSGYDNYEIYELDFFKEQLECFDL